LINSEKVGEVGRHILVKENGRSDHFGVNSASFPSCITEL